MHFSQMILSAEQLTCLQTLTAMVAAKDEFRVDFKRHLAISGDHAELSAVELSRLLSEPEKRSYEKQVLLYDFVYNEFVPKIIRNSSASDKSSARLRTQMERCSDILKPFFERFDSAFSALNPNQQSFDQEMPHRYNGDYVGYRRSSNRGEVIRFHLKVRTDEVDGSIRFENEYSRLFSHWLVNGLGAFSDNVLNLFGFARHKETNEGLGYRFMALQDLGLGGVLVGPLVSKDSLGPIAARVALVPFEAHIWTDRQKELLTVSTEALVQDLIQPKATHDKRAYIDEIKENLREAFPGYSERLIFRLISNFTLATVRGKPSIDDELVSQELCYLRLIHQSGNNLAYLAAPIERALSALSDQDIVPGQNYRLADNLSADDD